MSECRYCLGPCDDSHDASVRIHEWLKERVARVLSESVNTEPRPSKPHRQPPAIRVERPAVEPGPVRVKRKAKPPKMTTAAKLHEKAALIAPMFREGKSIREIQAATGFSEGAVYANIRRAGMTLQDRRIPVEAGMPFGSLTVIREIAGKPRVGRVMLCQCKCGKQTEARLNALRSGGRTSCGCLGAAAR
jgi:hypothetical protein